VIRRARPTDAAALARLRHEFRAGLDPAVEVEAEFLARCTAWMAERLEAGAAWLAWVAEVEDGIAGTVWIELIEKLPNPVGHRERHAYLTNFYVRPAHRGAGLGGALLAAALRACDERLVDALILWPTPASRGLYLRHGFAVRDDVLTRQR
jgi:GNAT superfamily N-acetyltransferase